MTKREIVEMIAEDLGITRVQASQIVERTFDSIVNTLVADGRVELRNFGVFAVNKRKPRKARNPRTGEKILVGERFTVTFKPGRLVGERVAMECGNRSVPGKGLVSAE